MEQKTAEQIAAEFMKPIYGFCLKRCANLQDAEDLTQEICLRLYRALLERNDIYSIEGFAWTVARNTLANYYRGEQRSGMGAPMDKLLETWPSKRRCFRYRGSKGNAGKTAQRDRLFGQGPETDRNHVLLRKIENRRILLES